jgi:hypothetical protein
MPVNRIYNLLCQYEGTKKDLSHLARNERNILVLITGRDWESKT